jgi:hypothetical protein
MDRTAFEKVKMTDFLNRATERKEIDRTAS